MMAALLTNRVIFVASVLYCTLSLQICLKVLFWRPRRVFFSQEEYLDYIAHYTTQISSYNHIRLYNIMNVSLSFSNVMVWK